MTEELLKQAGEIVNRKDNPTNYYTNEAYVEALDIIKALADEVRGAIKREKALVDAIESRPKHCEYMTEYGEFKDFDQYTRNVAKWAWKASKLTLPQPPKED